MHNSMITSKAWYRSRGVWGAILGFLGTLYGLYATWLPCGFWESLHQYGSSAVTLTGAYLGFVGRRTASQPIHFFWPYQASREG